jgi:hypothetical protein
LGLFSFNWLLSVLPTWLPLLVMAVGIALFIFECVVGFFSTTAEGPRFILKCFALAVFAYGAYLKGRQDTLLEYKKEINKIKVTQAATTSRIKVTYDKQIKTIRAKNEALKSQINTKDNANCELPESFIRLHNDAAKD